MDTSVSTERIEECLGPLNAVPRSILRNGHDSADAVQAALFLGRPKRDQLRDASRFRPWVMRISHCISTAASSAAFTRRNHENAIRESQIGRAHV